MLETWTWGPGLRPKLWMLPKQQRRPKKKRLNMMRKRYFTTLNMKSKNLGSFFEKPNVDYCKHYQCTRSNKAAQYLGGKTNLKLELCFTLQTNNHLLCLSGSQVSNSHRHVNIIINTILIIIDNIYENWIKKYIV